jgi:hypothetical protein
MREKPPGVGNTLKSREVAATGEKQFSGGRNDVGRNPRAQPGLKRPIEVEVGLGGVVGQHDQQVVVTVRGCSAFGPAPKHIHGQRVVGPHDIVEKTNKFLVVEQFSGAR